MTWTCHYCDRKFADDRFAREGDHAEHRYCGLCGGPKGVDELPRGGTDEETVDVWRHAHVTVQDTEGNTHPVLSCRVRAEDVNNDGTVSMPPSGECDCFEEVSPFKEDIDDYEMPPFDELESAVVEKEKLRELVGVWRKKARQKPMSIRGTYQICADNLEELIDGE